MSLVTNVIFSHSILEDDNIMDEVNKFFVYGKSLVSCDDITRTPRGWYGGTKMLECCLYIGAINHFFITDFMKHIKEIKWLEPKHVQLIVQEQDDDQFRIIQMEER